MRTPLAEQRLRPELLHVLDTGAPRVHVVTEMSAPDVGRVLRRADDQFLLAPDPHVSLTPGGSLVAHPQGGVVLASSAATLADFPSVAGGFFHVAQEDPTLRLKALRWVPDPTFDRAVLRTFTARLERYPVPLTATYLTDAFQLQVYRATATPRWVAIAPGSTVIRQVIEWTHTPLLPTPAVVPAYLIAWDGSHRADVTFNLAAYGLAVDNTPTVNPTEGDAGEVNAYYFVVRPAGVTRPDVFGWRLDAATARTVAGVGTFERAWWTRADAQAEWTQTVYADVPSAELEIEAYVASAQAVYVLDLGAAPQAASTGRLVFERTQPTGATATAELSTAGSGGPWTAVVHGQAITVPQQTYHVRLTLAPTAAGRASPHVRALGIEWRAVTDVSEESVGDPLPVDADVPWLRGTIGDTTLRVLRTGRRDYEDIATALGSRYAPASLEVDHYLASSHPAVTREHWHHLSRATVSNRVPSETSEEFTLLSYLSRLARKVPRKSETVNTVHTVGVGSTPSTVILNAGTPLAAAADEYDGQGYYLRVRASAVDGLTGRVTGIAGNTGTLQLDLSSPLAGALLAGDEVEVHSAIYTTVPLQWIDEDPAVIWWELLTEHAGIPTERIGRAGLGARSGLPPTVAMIAPGDATTQAKLTVTVHVAEQEPVGELLDQLSLILGGATLEVAGQIVFVQVHPLVDGAGNPTVVPGPLTAIFDPRDYANLRCPPGLEERACIVSATYGVNPTAAAGGEAAAAANTTEWVDADALAWHTQPDLEVLGTAEVPDKVTRWLYNTADGGLFLASEIARRHCLATSTGVRLWEWDATELRPEVQPGDAVAVLTDQATDYDPAPGTPIVGWAAWRLVVVGKAGNQRHLRGWVLGLAGNVSALQGGKAGTLGGVALAPIVVPTVSYAVEKRGRATSWVAYVVATFTPPATPHFDHMEYAVEQRPAPSVADPSPTWSAPVMVRGTRQGTDMLPVPFNVQVRVTPYTVSSGGTRTAGTTSPVQTVGNNPAPEVLAILATPSASYVDFEIEVDDDTQVLLVYLEERTADSGAAPDLADGTRAPLVWDRRLFTGNLAVVRQDLASASNYACLTVVPLDGLNQPGTEVSAYEQGDAAALLPLAPASGAHASTTSTTATVNVTLQNPWTSGGSPAPTHLRLYRGGVLATEVAVSVAAGGTQAVVATGLSPSTTYANWEVATMAGGVESTRVVVPGSATTGVATLDAPTGVTLTRSGDWLNMSLAWTAGANNPGGGATTFDIDQWNGGGWTTVETGWVGTSYNGTANFIPAVGNMTPDQFRVRATASGYTASAYTTSNWA